MEEQSTITAFRNDDIIKNILTEIFPLLSDYKVVNTLGNLYNTSKDSINERDQKILTQIITNDYISSILFTFGNYKDQNIFEYGKNLVRKVKNPDKTYSTTLVERLYKFKNTEDFKTLAKAFPVLDRISPLISEKPVAKNPIYERKYGFNVTLDIDPNIPVFQVESYMLQFKALMNGEFTIGDENFKEEIADILKDVFIAGLIQSGFNKAGLSFVNYAPIDFIQSLLRPAIESYNDLQDNESAFTRFLVGFTKQFKYNNPSFYRFKKEERSKRVKNNHLGKNLRVIPQKNEVLPQESTQPTTNQQSYQNEFTYDNKTIGTEFNLGEDQTKALVRLIDFVKDGNEKDVITLQGAAGTGKTAIIGYLQKYLGSKYSFAYMAPTHAATAELAFSTSKIGNQYLPSTIASSLVLNASEGTYKFTAKIKKRLGYNPVIVVDESSMLSPEDVNNLEEAIEDIGGKLIFLGDEKQIPKVDKNNVASKTLSTAFTNFEKISLNKVFRQTNNDLLTLLGEIRDQTDFKLFKVENSNNVKFVNRKLFNKELISDLESNPENTVVISYTNSSVQGINQMVRKILGRDGETVVGDIVVGYLGYASKQIEKGHVANSISYTIDKIESNGSAKVLYLSSKKLGKLKSLGIEGINSGSQTTYYQLTDKDSLTFDDLNKDDFNENNKTLSEIFAKLNKATVDFNTKQIRYGDYLDIIADISQKLASYSVGNDYVYNPSTDKMELYDKVKHKNIKTNGQGSLLFNKDIDYGHAITIHKSQGTTIENVYFDASTLKSASNTPVLDENGKQVTTERQSLAYVAMSRSKNKLVVDTGDLDFEEIPLESQEKVVPLQETVDTTTINQLSEYTNHSGGALGADTEWDKIGKKFGMVNNNHYYTGTKGADNAPNGNFEISETDVTEGQQKATIAARQMGRIQPTHQVRDVKLIRNWAQVKYSDAIFAISEILGVGDKMNYGKEALIVQGKGGTGYAMQMAINEGKPVYMFDQKRKVWVKNINGVWSKSEVPVLTPNFAGIGTREINDAGKQAIKDVYKKTKESLPKEGGIQYQLNNGEKPEQAIASEKTIRDLAARISDRIGIPYKFISDRSQQFKGKLDNIAVINLAYATLDTPIHEILGHPIVRTIKNQIKDKQFYLSDGTPSSFGIYDKNGKEVRKNVNDNTEPTQLYQNLLKELEYGKGKEVLDRIKRDYTNKTNEYDYSKGEKISDEEYDNIKASEEKTGSDEYLGRDFYEKRIGDKVYTIQKGEDANPNSARVYTLPTYSLEEQQEEAIVELLGLMTAEKLDKVKDGKLISLLKRLLKEMKAFMKQLLGQKEVEIDKLPDNMTIGDIADLLAYSNNKLILPEYEVQYTTPDNNKFKTYSEASSHISKLTKNTQPVYPKNQDEFDNYWSEGYRNTGKVINNFPEMVKNFVDLDKVSINKELSKTELDRIKELENIKKKEEDYLNSKEYQEEKTKLLKELSTELQILKNKKVIFDTQEPYLDREDSNKYGFKEFTWVRVESSHGRKYNNPFPEFLGKNYQGYYIHGYNTDTRDGQPATKAIAITKEEAEKLWEKSVERFPADKYEVQDRQDIYRKETEIKKIEKDFTIKYKIHIISQEIDQIKQGDNSLNGFISKNKEYEQSKEIIEEWKKVNNIHYNPEEIYSRGQEFSSVVGAYSSFDVNLMMQNLLSHIEDNEKANNHNKITSKDKIVFGHPTIGKSYLKQKGNNEFITLDDDYADEVNAFVDVNRGSETRQEYKGRKPKEYNQFMLNLFDRLKIQAQKEGKKLFVSNTNILKERMSEFDKVITMPKDEFKKRFDARGTTYGFEDWKSDIDATVAKVDKSKVINTTDYLSDLFSKGSGFAISAYTKPIDKQIGHLEGGGGKIKFKLYPKSEDILWAANTDVYSGSVWDASEKVNKDKKSELLGVSYTKYPALNNVNSIQPNLASIVDDLSHHHNELGIVLTGNNFRLEYDEDVPYQTKKIIDSVNKILDQKYGKLVRPEVNTNNQKIKKYSLEVDAVKQGYFDTKEEAERVGKLAEQTGVDYLIKEVYVQQGIQPTQTNETLKESIDGVKSEITNDLGTGNFKAVEDQGFWRIVQILDNGVEVGVSKEEDYYEPFIFDTEKEATNYIKKGKQKEYTSQALINTKISALKEIAKKYPRILIRSEVKKIGDISLKDQGFDMFVDELPFQLLSISKQQENLNKIGFKKGPC